jgi:hypothetical protein
MPKLLNYSIIEISYMIHTTCVAWFQTAFHRHFHEDHRSILSFGITDLMICQTFAHFGI